MIPEASVSPWRIGDPSTPVVDITVPYANENRNRVLLSEWRRQGGERVPAPPMLLPRHSEGTYRARIWKQNLLDFFLEDQYSDALAGSTGGPGGHLEDRIVTSVTLSGEWRFTTQGQRSTAAAGMVCVRRNEDPWDFEIARGTRAVTLVLPASEIRFPANLRAVTAEQASPAAALLLAQLRLWAELADGLGAAAAGAARNATLELFRGLMNDQVIDDAEFAPALLRAAMGHIETRLLADPDLNPQGIAAALNVSVRTLYRAFGQGATSPVMGYVRERRLECARAELISTRLTVSEIAARWHFADSSHFVKAYKKRFTETPTAGR
ncbi:transcriptional regulator, AraC family [Actinacidiphila yanglinensis]|uniref:Transcriptional regulator, AraC family n=1 Tax=Actinacidiphila yanglinensis TaxID=310779 RepID=A0A1H6DDR1_9ACTN|nr:helix-turn-helix transcriptional regulator [Actinacidiphila yanglinensis]SEG83212.1 transcriptional regulator, AraC family [Actinacidiphila yanglinensis]